MVSKAEASSTGSDYGRRRAPLLRRRALRAPQSPLEGSSARCNRKLLGSSVLPPSVLAHQLPQFLWGGGHVDVFDAEGSERVNDGVDHGRAGCDGAGLSDALDAHGIA